MPERGYGTDHFKQTVMDFCFGKTIQEVAINLNEPYSNVERWYYEQAEQRLPSAQRMKPPEKLCLDEFAIGKCHIYAFALMGPTTGHIWQSSEGKRYKKG